jgi:surface polysaccharide O-acyltransferase-like enzyme
MAAEASASIHARGVDVRAKATVRNSAVDALKLSLSVMVVGIHVHFLAEVAPNLSYLLANGLFRIAVPIFFLINGYYFFSAVQRSAWRNWFVRVAGLYCVWMLVYAPFWLDLEPSARSLLKLAFNLVIGYHHLWYLPGMAGAAVLVLLARRVSTRLMLAGCLAAFLSGVVLQYGSLTIVVGDVWLGKVLSQVWIHRNAVLLAFPFFGLGYLIARDRLFDGVSKAQVKWVAAVGLILLLAEAAWASGPFAMAPLDNLASLAVICPAVFLLAKKTSLVPRGSKELALVASGVYFTHPLVIRFVDVFELRVGAVRIGLVVLVSFVAATLLIPLSKRFRYVL